MGARPTINRRADIAVALKRAKPDDLLSLEDLANVWGTTKGPFVTAKKQMIGMPPAILQGTQHIYNARRALKAMLNYETRNDAAASARAEKQSAILGGMNRRRSSAAAAAALPARDLAVLSRLAAETEEREREQRLYIPAAEVARDVGEVFSRLSEFMAGLSNRVDPNGLLEPALRGAIDAGASEALLGFHGQLKKLLSADAVAGADRGKAGSARAARARRTRH